MLEGPITVTTHPLRTCKWCCAQSSRHNEDTCLVEFSELEILALSSPSFISDCIHIFGRLVCNNVIGTA